MSKLLDFRIPEKQLFDLYLNQGLSIKKLALFYGVSDSTIDARLRKYAIPKREQKAREKTRANNVTRRVLSVLNATHLAIQERSKWEPGFLPLYRSYQKRAEARGWPFELTEQQLYTLVKGDCHYCGIAPSIHGKGMKFTRNGVDRADNSQGYTIENSRSCCWPCNRIKRAMSEQQFLAHVLRIANHQAKQLVEPT